MCAKDGAVVLILRVEIAGELTGRAAEFYRNLADAFCESVRGSLYPHALDMYAACTDRRRRYRFPALTADFSVTFDGEAAELTIAENGGILLLERHLWDGDVIKKRMKTGGVAN